MLYQIVATGTMVIHFTFLVYVVIGGFIAWRWPRTIWIHLAAAAWGLGSVIAGLECPLTYVEHWARRKAGEQGLTRGFIDTYIEGIIYPEQYTRVLQVLVGLAVLISWVGYARRRARRPRPAA